ncbi:hypothetical protein CRG98_006939, partial [Punica granatum]
IQHETVGGGARVTPTRDGGGGGFGAIHCGGSRQWERERERERERDGEASEREGEGRVWVL